METAELIEQVKSDAYEMLLELWLKENETTAKGTLVCNSLCGLNLSTHRQVCKRQSVH